MAPRRQTKTNPLDQIAINVSKTLGGIADDLVAKATPPPKTKPVPYRKKPGAIGSPVLGPPTPLTPAGTVPRRIIPAEVTQVASHVKQTGARADQAGTHAKTTTKTYKTALASAQKKYPKNEQGETLVPHAQFDALMKLQATARAAIETYKRAGLRYESALSTFNDTVHGAQEYAVAQGTGGIYRPSAEQRTEALQALLKGGRGGLGDLAHAGLRGLATLGDLMPAAQAPVRPGEQPKRPLGVKPYDLGANTIGTAQGVAAVTAAAGIKAGLPVLGGLAEQAHPGAGQLVDQIAPEQRSSSILPSELAKAGGKVALGGLFAAASVNPTLSNNPLLKGTGPLTQGQKVAREGVQILRGFTQLPALGMMLTDPNTSWDEKYDIAVEQVIVPTLEDLRRRYGEDVTLAELWQISKDDPLIMGLNAAAFFSGASRVLTGVYGLRGGATVGEALRAIHNPSGERLLTLRGAASEVVRRPDLPRQYGIGPRPAVTDQLTGDPFFTPEGGAIEVPVQWARSPLVRTVVNRPYDWLSRQIEGSGARRVPVLRLLSENSRAARQLQRNNDYLRRRMPAWAQGMMHSVQEYLKSDEGGPEMQLALTLLLQKPSDFTDDEFLDAVLQNLKHMEETGEFIGPEGRPSPAAARLIASIRRNEGRSERARVKRRARASRNISGEQLRLAVALDQLSAHRDLLLEERKSIREDADLSDEDRAMWMRESDLELRANAAQRKVAREHLDDLSIHLDPVENTEHREAWRAELEKAPKIGGGQALSDLPDAVARPSTTRIVEPDPNAEPPPMMGHQRVYRIEEPDPAGGPSEIVWTTDRDRAEQLHPEPGLDDNGEPLPAEPLTYVDLNTQEWRAATDGHDPDEGLTLPDEIVARADAGNSYQTRLWNEYSDLWLKDEKLTDAEKARMKELGEYFRQPRSPEAIEADRARLTHEATVRRNMALDDTQSQLVDDGMQVSDIFARRWGQRHNRNPADFYDEAVRLQFTAEGEGIPEGAFFQTREPGAGDEVNLPDQETLRQIAFDGVDVSVFREHDIDGFLRKIPEYLRRGAPYRKWYEDSGRAILALAQGDKDLAARIAQVVAIYSASRAPTENINLALRAYRKWQETGGTSMKGVGTAVQQRKAMLAMKDEDWGSRKTNRFYANMLKWIDPERYAREFPGGEVTNDIWMARLFGLKTDQPTPREYEQMSRLVQNVASELGWSPEEVQAALWVPAKADAGLKGKPMSDHEAGIDFARALNQEAARIPIEAAPGRRVGSQGILRRYDDLDGQTKFAYMREKKDAVLEFMRATGLFGRVETEGAGLFRNDTNPAFTIVLPIAGKASTLYGRVERRAILDVISIVGDALNQDAMAWFRPFYRKIDNAPGRQKGVHVTTTRELTPDEALTLQRGMREKLARPLNADERREYRAKEEAKLGRKLNREEITKMGAVRVGGDVALPPAPEGGIYALNYSGRPNPAFHAALEATLKEIGEAGDDLSATYSRFDFDGDLRTRGRYGQVHGDMEGRFAGRPDVQQAAHHLRARSDDIDRRYLGGSVDRGGRGEAGVPAEVPGTDRPSANAGRGGGPGPPAADRLGDYQPLDGLPPRRTRGGEIATGPSAEVRRLAHVYSERSGISYTPATSYVEVDAPRAKRIADAYDEMLDLNDPKATPEYRDEVAASYQAMADETIAQNAVLEEAGYRFEFYPRNAAGEAIDPYHGNPWGAMRDLRDNKHLYVFPTDAGFGGEGDFDRVMGGDRANPLLADSGIKWNGQTVLVNDLFRAVHDVFGHFKEGVGFRAHGEENAWRSHSAMYSPEARKAMTSETRGQNSWVNYGPHAERNRTANQIDTVYAEQKTGVLPQWVVHEGAPPRTMAQTRRNDVLGATEWLNTAPGRRIIHLTERADISTLLHELIGHGAYEMKSFYPEEFVKVEERMGKRLEDWTRDDHEQFARWGEQYFLHGEPPTPELVDVMDRLKGWMRAIYAGMTANLGARMPTEVRTLFDTFFGAYDDENVYRIAMNMGREGWGIEDLDIQRYGSAAVVSQEELRALKRRQETSRAKRTIVGMKVELADLEQQLADLRENSLGVDGTKQGAFTQAQAERAADLSAKIMDRRNQILIREDKREMNLRKKFDLLEKAMSRGFDNRRFQGALHALQQISMAREEVLRETFGRDFDKVFGSNFEDRRDLLADWLVERGLLRPDFTRGTAYYFPHSAEDAAVLPPQTPGQPLTGRVVGRTKTDQLNLYKRNQMILWQQGNWNADPVVLMESYMRATSFQWMTEVKKQLWELGRPLTQVEAANLGPDVYLVNLNGTPISRDVRSQLKAGVEQQDHPLSTTVDPQRVHDAIDGTDNDRLETSLTGYWNNFMLDGEKLPPDFNPLKPSTEVRVVPKEVVHALLRPLRGGRTTGGKALDIATTMARFSLIYANAPAYMLANATGNLALLLMTKPWQLAKISGNARKLLGDPLIAYRIYAETGDLPAFAAISRGRSFDLGSVDTSAAIRKGEQWWLKHLSVVDQYPRAWAWIAHAGELGYRSSDDIIKLLDGKTAKTARDRLTVSQAATNSMIDFNKLRPWESLYLTRALFIWPFVRGSTAWPFWYVKNYPERAAVLSNFALTAEDRRRRMLGPQPRRNEGLFPISTHGSGKYRTAQVMNANVASPTSTLMGEMEAAGDVANYVLSLFGKGDGKAEPVSALLDMISPVATTVLELATQRNDWGQPLGPADLLTDITDTFIPGLRLLNSSLEHPLYGENRTPRAFMEDVGPGDQLRRTWIRLAPQTLTIQYANAQAAERGTETATEQIQRLRNVAMEEWNQNHKGEPFPAGAQRAIVLEVMYDQKGKERAHEKAARGAKPAFVPEKIKGSKDRYDWQYHVTLYERAKIAYSVARKYMPEAEIANPDTVLMRYNATPTSEFGQDILNDWMSDDWGTLKEPLTDISSEAADLASQRKYDREKERLKRLGLIDPHNRTIQSKKPLYVPEEIPVG